ncbi:MAG: hypothetical protein JEY99_16050 [Spirochaetales bacterium]|nr:hypothetical protein [Spirochaetales bacterium]
MKKNIRKSIMENELPVHSAWVYSEIKQELQPPIIASSTLAEDLFLKKWMEEGEKEPELISRYLESVRTQHGGMTCFLVSEKTRTYYNMIGGFPITEDDADAQWYFDFIKNNEKSSISTSLNVDMDNMPTVFINEVHDIKTYSFGNHIKILQLSGDDRQCFFRFGVRI